MIISDTTKRTLTVKGYSEVERIKESSKDNKEIYSLDTIHLGRDLYQITITYKVGDYFGIEV